MYYREQAKQSKLWTFLSQVLLIACVGLCFYQTLPEKEMPSPVQEISVLTELSMVGPMPLYGPEKQTLATGTFTEPCMGVLTSPFGARWGKTHCGIDIGGETDSAILAADGGVIAFAGWVEGYGNFISIDHQNGYETAYAHLNSILVSEGDWVTQGQKIALMGSTGNSTGPHLHFEVKKNGDYVDPQHFVLY